MATESQQRPAWLGWLPWCLIWLWGCVAYHNTFAGVYVYDDYRGILQNPRVLAGPALHEWLRPVTRPLTEATFALNYSLGGFERWGWHFGNLLVHLLTAGLWYWLVRDGLQRHGWSQRTGWSDSGTAALCALVWVAHPLTTEGVTYLVQRSEALAACGMLATLVGWNRFVLGTQFRGWGLAWAFVCAMAAAASKPTAVVLPLLVWLYDRDIRLSANRPPMVSTRGRIAGLALLWVPTLWILSDAYLVGLFSSAAVQTQGATAGVGAAGLTAGDYLTAQSGVVCYYLGLIFSATSQSLDYGWLVPEHPAVIWGTAAALLFLLVLSIFLWLRHAGWGLLAVAYFALLLPTSSIIPLRDLAVEHRVYLPSACVLALLVLGVMQAASVSPSQATRRTVLAGLLLYGAFVAVRTIQRNGDYHDETVLWSRAVTANPAHPRNYGMLGTAWQKRGDLTQAREAFAACVDRYRAAQGKPVAPPVEHANAYSQLATVTLELGDPQRAHELLTAAVELAPGVAIYWSNLGSVFDRRQQVTNAIDCYQRALELDPRLTLARINLARLWMKQEQLSEALAVLESAPPESAPLELRHLLAETYRRLERFDDAHAVYRQLDDQQLATADTWQARGKLYRQQGDYAAALSCFQRAARMTPHDPWPLALQAEMLARLGHYPAADQLAERLLQRLPADSVVAEQLQTLRASLRASP